MKLLLGEFQGAIFATFIAVLLAVLGWFSAKSQGRKDQRARQTEQDMKRSRMIEEKADAARDADKSGTPDDRLLARGRLRD